MQAMIYMQVKMQQNLQLVNYKVYVLQDTAKNSYYHNTRIKNFICLGSFPYSDFFFSIWNIFSRSLSFQDFAVINKGMKTVRAEVEWWVVLMEVSSYFTIYVYSSYIEYLLFSLFIADLWM